MPFLSKLNKQSLNKNTIISLYSYSSIFDIKFSSAETKLPKKLNKATKVLSQSESFFSLLSYFFNL